MRDWRDDEIERLRYELKRFHEASAAGRDWEKLWAEREDEIERLRDEVEEWQSVYDAEHALFLSARSVAASAALEEAAKVAEIYKSFGIAKAIRALKEKQS